jgi:hypothetical protein
MATNTHTRAFRYVLVVDFAKAANHKIDRLMRPLTAAYIICYQVGLAAHIPVHA